jgi:Zn-finger nucleic acid-binding protein
MTGYANDDEVAKALEEMTGRKFTDNEGLVPSGRRPCPICDNPMRVETCNGISLDVCPAHGVWLDNGELPALLAAARAKGGRPNLEALKRARQEGKISGALLGVWSMILP